MGLQGKTVEDGYYLATPKYCTTKKLVEVRDGEVSIYGDDRSYYPEDFSELSPLKLLITGAILAAYGAGLQGQSINVDELISTIFR